MNYALVRTRGLLKLQFFIFVGEAPQNIQGKMLLKFTNELHEVFVTGKRCNLINSHAEILRHSTC